MKIKLSDHFTYRRLFRFVLPSIAMMIFTSIYGVVDGFFVSNFAGKIEFAAVNLILPFPMMLGAFYVAKCFSKFFGYSRKTDFFISVYQTKVNCGLLGQN